MCLNWLRCSTINRTQRESVEIGTNVKRTNVVSDTVARKDFARDGRRKETDVDQFCWWVTLHANSQHLTSVLVVRSRCLTLSKFWIPANKFASLFTIFSKTKRLRKIVTNSEKTLRLRKIAKIATLKRKIIKFAAEKSSILHTSVFSLGNSRLFASSRLLVLAGV